MLQSVAMVTAPIKKSDIDMLFDESESADI